MIEFTLDKKQLNEITSKLKHLSPKDQHGITVKAFRDVTLETEGYLKTNILSGQVLRARTGALRSSMQSVITNNDGELLGLVGSGVRSGGRATRSGKTGKWNADGRLPYANIHETGGVIKPKPPNKYLTIPIRAGSIEAIGMGIWKYKSGARKGQQKKPISFSSKILTFRKVKSVTIPARRYLTKTVQAMSPRVMDIMMARIERELSNG